MVERFTVYPGVTYHTGQPHQNIKGEYVLYSDYASLQKELAERTAERDAALSEVDDLQSQAEVVAEEFEKDCWKAMRSLLSSCNFNWQDVQPDGVTADDAREYISRTLDELEKGEQRWKARADTLARRVEGLEAALRDARSKIEPVSEAGIGWSPYSNGKTIIQDREWAYAAIAVIDAALNQKDGGNG